MGKLRLLFLLVAAVGPHAAADFIVSPDGSPDGDGTFERPWDLQTALAQPIMIQPGDHVWLRGGVYRGAFKSKLTGLPSKPIVVRNYEGERAILDYPDEPQELQVLRIDGAWTWYWGLEVMSSWTNRIDPPKHRATGVNVYGPNVKLINMVIHDTFGVGFWSGSDDSEMYGNIVYNNGNDMADRGHGHGIYAQNKDGSKRLIDNVVFQNFSHGLHIFGSDAAFLNNFYLEGNTSFNNGVLSRFGEERNILVGGGVITRNPVLVSNFTYWSKASTLGQNNVGYLAGCDKVVAKDNYFAIGIAFTLINCKAETVTGNTFIGGLNGVDRAQFPDNTFVPFNTKPTSGVRIFVRPNQFEESRGHIVVFNWEGRETVDADVKDILKPGQYYEVRDVQNLFGSPVAKGVYDGSLLTLPLKLTEVAETVGAVPVPPAHTSTEFNAFLIRAVPEPLPPAPDNNPESGRRPHPDEGVRILRAVQR